MKKFFATIAPAYLRDVTRTTKVAAPPALVDNEPQEPLPVLDSPPATPPAQTAWPHDHDLTSPRPNDQGTGLSPSVGSLYLSKKLPKRSRQSSQDGGIEENLGKQDGVETTLEETPTKKKRALSSMTTTHRNQDPGTSQDHDVDETSAPPIDATKFDRSLPSRLYQLFRERHDIKMTEQQFIVLCCYLGVILNTKFPAVPADLDQFIIRYDGYTEKYMDIYDRGMGHQVVMIRSYHEWFREQVPYQPQQEQEAGQSLILDEDTLIKVMHQQRYDYLRARYSVEYIAAVMQTERDMAAVEQAGEALEGMEE